ncbi:MAG: hypothetical protein P4L81_07245 [Candidatus Pacebacteria bacterium]|nr:hypothetical protein [Candidatus Paceibacterota bacterium]
MKPVIASVFALTLSAFPALTFAQSWQTVGQLTAIAASLEARQNSISTGEPLACAALFSTTSTKVGQQVSLAWGSVGAVDPLTSSSSVSMWPQQGFSTLSFTKVGTWTYYFTFYNNNAASTTCSAKIAVTK